MVRIGIKEGKNSKTRKMGAVCRIELFCPIQQGFSIKAKKELDNLDPRRQEKGIPKTSYVLDIEQIDSSTYKVETENSFYEVTLFN